MTVPTWKKVEVVSRLFDLGNYILHPEEGDEGDGFMAELREEFDRKVALLREWGWTHAADELAQRVSP